MDLKALTRQGVDASGLATYGDAATKATKSHSYLRAADTALIDVTITQYQQSGDTGPVPGRPQLQTPRMPVKGADAEAEDTFTLLMASLIALLGAVQTDSLKSRMEMLKAAASAAAAGNLELSDKYLAAVDAFLAASAVHADASKNLRDAKAQLDSAQARLEQAQATLDKTPVDSPEHAEALKALDLAQKDISVAGQKMAGAEAVHQAAGDVLMSAAATVEKLARQMEAMAGQPTPEIIEGMKKQMNAAATQVELMMKLAELLGKSAESKLENELELSRTMQAARQEYLEKESEKYLEQVRKAEAASKTMGCIGKILGAVLTVASVVGAAFTGGASLVLAGVGIALMGADMIGKAITGVSFMEKATQPLMDKVLGPMIQAIGKSIGDVLKKMGVDAQTAEMAGNILGAIVGAVAMIAVMAVVVAVGKGAGARVAGSMGNLLGKMTSKMAPDMLKQAARSVSKGVTNGLTRLRTQVGLKSDPNSLAMYGSRAGAGVAGIEAGGVVGESAMGVKSGMHQKEAAKHLAEAQMTMAISETLKAWVDELVQAFGEITKSVDQFRKNALAIQDNTQNTALNMARNI